MKENYNLPQVVEMEKAVLGAMLLKDGEIVPAVCAILTDQDFYREEHRIIFRAILRLTDRKIPPNLLMLIDELRTSKELDKVGIKLVMAMADASYTTAYAEVYSQKIKEKSILRKLIEAGEEISEEAFLDRKSLEEILDEAEQKIFAVTSHREMSNFEIIKPIIQRAVERINAAVRDPDGLTGVKSHFIDLDRVTSGFQKSDLILIAARPSMGKTAFALNIALNAAVNDVVVAIFSLEMSKGQIGHRLLSLMSGIDAQRLNTGKVSEEEMNEMVQASESISATKIFIDDTPGISVMELRSKARRLKQEHGLDIVFIDYLQLMQGSIRRNAESRQQEISEISRSLKALARELNVPVIALSQLSRGVELRAEKKPQLSDLRESGSLEQDADIVMFLYREEYYNRDTDKKNSAELIIAKNRNGPTTSIGLQFTKECMKFSSLTYREE